MMKIPFNKPAQVGCELEYIQQAIKYQHLSGDGYFTKQSQVFIENILNIPKALLTPSCTHALEMSAILLDIKPGDEVIAPDFTFVSTVNAFVLRGANPVFVDIRPDTLNIDETKIESAITEKTKAIVVVHYGGVGCEMDSIMALAKKYNLAVVEDNAHGLFGRYKGRNLGSFGALATQSFHETKNIQCGEGGALLINDESMIERAEIIREKGTNRNRFFRGQVDKYTWVDIGSSMLPSELQAAYLFAQLENKDKIQKKRKKVWDAYQEQLAAWSEVEGIRQPLSPTYCEHTHHVYYLLLPNLQSRQNFISHMRNAGISAVFHYLPLHLSKMGKTFGGQVGTHPITENISDQLIRLPLYYDLSEKELEYVITTIKSFNGT